QRLALRDEGRVEPRCPSLRELGAGRRGVAAPLDAGLGRAVLAYADDGAAAPAGDVRLLARDIALVDPWHGDPLRQPAPGWRRGAACRPASAPRAAPARQRRPCSRRPR